MTKNERTARGLLKIKAGLSESATVGELIRAWTAYLDEQDLVTSMNYDEMAREIIGALEKAKWENSGTYGWPLGFDVVATKLKELLPIPEDLEAAIEIAVRRCAFDLRFYKNGRVDRDKLISEIKGRIIFTVAPFCQKPEVPKDLETAVRKAIGDSPPALTSLSLNEMAKHVCSAVALLLAERGTTLKMQHDAIIRMDKRVKGLERQRASIRLGIHDTLRRLERADSTMKCWADKNNIRNCLVGLQRTAAKESSDED